MEGARHTYGMRVDAQENEWRDEGGRAGRSVSARARGHGQGAINIRVITNNHVLVSILVLLMTEIKLIYIIKIIWAILWRQNMAKVE